MPVMGINLNENRISLVNLIRSQTNDEGGDPHIIMGATDYSKYENAGNQRENMMALI